MNDSIPKLTLAQQIDQICDRFEAAWSGDERPRIEEYLGEVKEPIRSALLQALVQVEAELLQRAGQLARAEDYAARFPEHTAIVREALAGNSVRSGSARPGGPAEAKRSPAATQSLRIGEVDTSHSASPLPEPGPHPIPNQIGRFKVLELLGEGGFGAVYLAHDPQLDRDVAIKVPRARSFQTPADRERFVREARASATLTHSHICPVHEIGEADGALYIVMAFIDGKPLSKLIDAGKVIPERQAIGAVRKLALALQDAHDKGVVHRDLKPANIMVNRKGEPVVMDFGLARRTIDGDVQLTQSGAIMGTPAYMSPEQARGDGKNIGRAADIYSLGVILYELLCGRRPFTGTLTEVLGQILHVTPDPPSHHRAGLAPQLDTICMKAMAKAEAERYGSMRDFAEALAGYLRSTDPRVVGTATHDAPKVEASSNASAILAAPGVSAAAETARATEGSTHVARLIDGLQSEMRSLARRSHDPRWLWLIGAGFLGIFLLLGIIFFTRTATATVLINIEVNLKDPELRFVLDEKEVPAETLTVPMELAVGNHELLVWRGEKLERKFQFEVKGGAEPAIAIKEVTQPPIGDSPPIAKAPFDARQARAHQEAWATYLGTKVETTNSVGMKMVLIPPGEFMMGSTDEQVQAALKVAEEIKADPSTIACIQSERPQHRVVIAKPFLIGASEVTVGEFKKFAAAKQYRTDAEKAGSKETYLSPPYDVNDDSPAACITWNDAKEYCQWLSKVEETTHRLPTEAEWEYVCRAGTTTQYSFGDDDSLLSKYAWYEKNSERKSYPVGTKPANPFRLHDLHGNLWEWCHDHYDSQWYQHASPNDPTGPPVGSTRVIRGGSLFNNVSRCRSAFRINEPAGTSNFTYGFRVGRVLDIPVVASSPPVARPVGNPPPIAKAPFDAKQARAHQEAWATYLGTKVETTNSVGMTMVLIPPGEFLMGSSDEQIVAALSALNQEPNPDQNVASRIRAAERPQHKVVISKSFSMSATEVTIGQFKKFTEAGRQTEAEKADSAPTFRNPGHGATDDFPAAFITWNDAVAYCKWLSEQEKATYRLPTEAEWEYACRSGTTTQYSFGNDQTDFDRFGRRFKPGGRSHPVATLLPNAFGLFDMHGNLYEWCGDIFDEKWYETSPTIDPAGPASGPDYVTRGGGWNHGQPSIFRSAYRGNSHSYRYDCNGFRVVRECKVER